MPVRVVPVLDLMGGQVVRAVRGERTAYRPIVSPLLPQDAPAGDPHAVAVALLQATGGRVLYVADLDAILGGAAQAVALRRLLAALPDVTLWLDAGFRDRAAARSLAAAVGADGRRLQPVYGSESLGSLEALREIGREAILSLDSRAGQPLDPAGCRARPDLWPDTLVAMTLERVGAGAGPDLQAFARLRAEKPAARWVGAGGIRDRADLVAAAAAGADAWLVASALHDGRLGGPATGDGGGHGGPHGGADT